MTKRGFLFVLTLSFFSPLYSQLGKGFIGISGGINIPGGNFDQQELFNTTYSGFAQLGSSYSVFGGYMNNPYIGFIGEFTISTNEFDHEGFYDFLTADQNFTSSSPEPYRSNQYSVGILAGIPNNRSMGIFVYGQIGISVNSYASFKRTEKGVFEQTISGSEESDIYYGFGLFIPVRLADCFSLAIRASYTASKSQHTTEYYLIRPNTAPSRGKYTAEPIEINYVRFNFSIGLVYSIFRAD